MAAIRRSFSGALQRRRSASMTPEQKTEETTAPVRPGHVVYHAFAASYDWQVSVGLGEAVEVIETHEDGWSTVSTLSCCNASVLQAATRRDPRGSAH